MTSEADVELTHESQDPLHKELPELLLEPLHHHNLDNVLWPEPTVLQRALEGTEHKDVTHTAALAIWGINHPTPSSAWMAACFNSASHTGTGVAVWHINTL